MFIISEHNVGKIDEKCDVIMEDLVDDLTIFIMNNQIYKNFIPKSFEWYELVLPNLDDERYRQMLRVNREDFNKLVSLIENDDIFLSTKLQFSVQKQLAIVLYRLGCYGEGASIKKLASLFGIGDGATIDRITKRVFAAILNLKDKYIYWPNEQERIKIVDNTKNELPYCVGYLDGTEIKLAEAPVDEAESYFSRKSIYSLKAQAICDNKMLIRYAGVGFPGSMHDARMFSTTDIYKNPVKYLSEKQWIAADSAYKLTEHFVTPYRKNSNVMTLEDRNKFNFRLSQYRIRIEHCFGILKERFSSLKELKLRLNNENNNLYACQWFLTCCILHNILLQNNQETLECSENFEETLFVDDSDCSSNISGEIKRIELFNMMFN